MVCTPGLVEKDSPICSPCRGLFAQKALKKGAFVCFLTGNWSLQTESDNVYPPTHPAAGYVAVWDRVRVPNNRTRSKEVREDNLVVISHTRHSVPHRRGMSHLCRDDHCVVYDPGALMNSQPLRVANCMAESVVLPEDGVKSIRARKTRRQPTEPSSYPAIMIVTTRAVRSGEELTWPYEVPGVPAFDKRHLRHKSLQGEATDGYAVLKKWKAATGLSFVPKEICGPPLHWDVKARMWIINKRAVTKLEVLHAFDPVAPLVPMRRMPTTVEVNAPDQASGGTEPFTQAHGEARRLISYVRQRAS